MQKQPDEQLPAEGGARDALDGELPRLLRVAEPVPADLDALFREVERSVAAERGPRAWLRARSSAARGALAWAVIVAVAGATLLVFRRADLGLYPPMRMAAVLVVIGAGIALSLFLALRPLHRPAVPVAVASVVTAAALLGLLVLYALPPAHVEHPASLQPAGWPALLRRALPCLGIGVSIGGFIYGVLALLDRGGSARAAVMAAASGLAANLVLQLHCPVTAPLHMMLAHFGAAVLLVTLALLLRGFRRRHRWHRGGASRRRDVD